MIPSRSGTVILDPARTGRDASRIADKIIAHLICCIERAPEGLDGVAEAFCKKRDSRHGAVIKAAQAILPKRFTGDEKTKGYRKDGSVATAKFELGEGLKPERRDMRVLRQRKVNDLMSRLLRRIGRGAIVA